MYKFEKLTVWKESVDLLKVCYKTALDLPSYEKSGLSDQLRRAASSVSLNIAEGSGSNSDKDFCRYLLLSRKSLFEVVAINKIIESLYPNVSIGNVYQKSENVVKLLNGLIRKLKANG